MSDECCHICGGPLKSKYKYFQCENCGTHFPKGNLNTWYKQSWLPPLNGNWLLYKTEILGGAFINGISLSVGYPLEFYTDGILWKSEYFTYDGMTKINFYGSNQGFFIAFVWNGREVIINLKREQYTPAVNYLWNGSAHKIMADTIYALAQENALKMGSGNVWLSDYGLIIEKQQLFGGKKFTLPYLWRESGIKTWITEKINGGTELVFSNCEHGWQKPKRDLIGIFKTDYNLHIYSELIDTARRQKVIRLSELLQSTPTS